MDSFPIWKKQKGGVKMPEEKENVELECGCVIDKGAKCVVCNKEPIRGSKKIHGRFIHVCSDVCATTAYFVIDKKQAKA